MKLFKQAKKYGRRIAAAGVAAGAMVSEAAFAALDTTTVQTSLTAAQGTGETVGGYVIALTAGLAVIGIALGLVKRAGH